MNLRGNVGYNRFSFSGIHCIGTSLLPITLINLRQVTVGVAGVDPGSFLGGVHL